MCLPPLGKNSLLYNSVSFCLMFSYKLWNQGLKQRPAIGKNQWQSKKTGDNYGHKIKEIYLLREVQTPMILNQYLLLTQYRK